MLDTITATWKAESTHQEAPEASLGDFQGKLLNHLQAYSDLEWTTSMLAADLDKTKPGVSRALQKLVSLGKVVRRPQGQEVFYQATASQKNPLDQKTVNPVNPES